jgi:hypothetical protein
MWGEECRKKRTQWLVFLAAFVPAAIGMLVLPTVNRRPNMPVIATWIFAGPALLFVFLSLRQRRRRLRDFRRRSGLCVACGYDLRGPDPGDKCPECGTFIPMESATINAKRRRS